MSNKNAGFGLLEALQAMVADFGDDFKGPTIDAARAAVAKAGQAMEKLTGLAELRSDSLPWSIQPCQEDHGESTVVVDQRGYVISCVPSAAWNEKATDVVSQRDRANLNFMITVCNMHTGLDVQIQRAARETPGALATQHGLTANASFEEARGWMEEHEGQFSDEDRAAVYALLDSAENGDAKAIKDLKQYDLPPHLRDAMTHKSSGSTAFEGSPQVRDRDAEHRVVTPDRMSDGTAIVTTISNELVAAGYKPVGHDPTGGNSEEMYRVLPGKTLHEVFANGGSWNACGGMTVYFGKKSPPGAKREVSQKPSELMLILGKGGDHLVELSWDTHDAKFASAMQRAYNMIAGHDLDDEQEEQRGVAR